MSAPSAIVWVSLALWLPSRWKVAISSPSRQRRLFSLLAKLIQGAARHEKYSSLAPFIYRRWAPSRQRRLFDRVPNHE
jgi:hypothetical protein